MGETKVLLVSGPGKARTAYEKALKELEVAYDVIEGFEDIEGHLTETPYNGLLLDVPTTIHSTVSGKAKMHALLERYPVLRVIYDAGSDDIRGLAFGHTVREGRPLKDFVYKVCPNFVPRSIRVDIRKEVAMSVYVLDHPEMDLAKAKKSVLFNICNNGCFLFSTELIPEETVLWLKIVGNEVLDLVKTEVRWCEPWGEAGKIPGLGLAFKDLSDSEAGEVNRLCGIINE